MDTRGEVYATRSGDSWTYNKSINEGNLVDMVFYPEWPGEFNIYFLDHNGKVDNTHFVEYYRKNVFYTTEWIHHDHGYVKTAPDNCAAKGHYKSFTDYTAEGRPDREYWVTE